MPWTEQDVQERVRLQADHLKLDEQRRFADWLRQMLREAKRLAVLRGDKRVVK